MARPPVPLAGEGVCPRPTPRHFQQEGGAEDSPVRGSAPTPPPGGASWPAPPVPLAGEGVCPPSNSQAFPARGRG